METLEDIVKGVSMKDFGYLVKLSDIEYYIHTDKQGKGGDVVSIYSIGENAGYSFDDILAYVEDHPEKIVHDLSTPPMSENEKEMIARIHRDRLISSIAWRRERHNDEVLLGLEPTEPLLPILEYIQALRDVPQQEGFPTNIVWPEVPDDRQL